MKILKIQTTSIQNFGMAKSEYFEQRKFAHHLQAEASYPGTEEWFEHKNEMVGILKEQLLYDKGLTSQERQDLERDKFLLETDIQRQKDYMARLDAVPSTWRYKLLALMLKNKKD